MRKRLNVRFALILLASVAVLGTCSHFLHAYQVRRNAGAMLALADRAERDDPPQLEQAADYLGRYLTLNPDDAAALSRYGLLLADEKLATTGRAKVRARAVLEKVLYREPNNHDVRRRVARLSMDVGQYAAARDDIEQKLLKNDPKAKDDGQLALWLGLCYEFTGEYAKAREWYEKARQRPPKDVEAYGLLAFLIRTHPDQVVTAADKNDRERASEVPKRLADQIINDMVNTNDRSPRAHLIRAQYLNQYDRADKPEDQPKKDVAVAADVARALKLAPNDADALGMAVEVALKQRDAAANGTGDATAVQAAVDQTRAGLQGGIKLQPKEPRLYDALARLEHGAGRPDAALAALAEGLKQLPNQKELLWDEANILSQLGKKAEAQAAIARLAKAGYPADALDVLRARLAAADEHWHEAAALLEDAVPKLIGRAPQGVAEGMLAVLIRQGDLLLARCYEQQADTERAYDTYSRLVTRDPRSTAGQLGVATALWGRGQHDEALDRFRQALVLPDAPPAAWVTYARLVFQRALETNTLERNREVDRAIEQAENVLKKVQSSPSPEIAILRAEVRAVNKDFDGARAALLEKYGDPKDRPVSVWIALAALEERRGQPAAALAVLDDAGRACGDAVNLRLARAQYLIAHDRAAARPALAVLEQGLDKFPAADRHRLLRGLSDAYRAAGDLGEAARLRRQLAGDQGWDLSSYVALFNLAAQTENDVDMGQWAAKIKEVEGETGPLGYYAQANVLIARAKKVLTDLQRPDFWTHMTEARSQLTEAAKRRPKWSLVALSEGRLDELVAARNQLERRDGEAAGYRKTALEKYRKAIDQGVYDPAVIRRAIDLLAAEQRYPEAYALFAKIPDRVQMPAELRRTYAELALRANRVQEAVDLARAAVPVGSKDYRDQMWLGRLLWAANRLDEADKAFAAALDLAETAPDAWAARVRFLAFTGQQDKARAELEAGRRRLKGAIGSLALAVGYEVLGQRDAAGELYRAAATAAPDDPDTLRGAAAFAVRSNRPKEAVGMLQKLTGLPGRPPEVVAADKRLYALALALAGNNPAAAASAQKQLNTDEVQDQRMLAILFATQTTERQQRAAAEILEGLIDRNVATPDDYFLAGQLYEMLGDRKKARAKFDALLELPGERTAAQLHRIARGLLVLDRDRDAARPVVGKLQAVAPQAFPTFEVTARLYKLQDRMPDAVELLTRAARADPKVSGAAARLLEEFNKPADAEVVYREAANRPEAPAGALALADFLARQKKFPEALDQCDQAWATADPVLVADVCLQALSQAPAEPRRYDQVDARLQAALTKAPDRAELLVAQATLRNFQGRYADAIDLYRRALAKDGRNITALNNLACLLILTGGRGPAAEEAVQRAEEAAKILGDDPSLLDTKAMAYLSRGTGKDFEQAVADLKKVTTATPASATAFFHLAQAYARSGHKQEAAKAWEEAKKLGLDPKGLHPLERPGYEELKKQLN
jgi:tetratricopeptide (TPR) repeat protein